MIKSGIAVGLLGPQSLRNWPSIARGRRAQSCRTRAEGVHLVTDRASFRPKNHSPTLHEWYVLRRDQRARESDRSANHPSTYPRSILVPDACLPNGCVNQDLLTMPDSELHMLEKHNRFVAGVLIEPNFPDPSTFGRSRNSGIMAITSRERLTFSASFALMHNQV